MTSRSKKRRSYYRLGHGGKLIRFWVIEGGIRVPRINVDTKFFGDKRVEFLTQVTKENIYTIQGRLLNLWNHCYNRVSEVLERDEIDMHSGWYDGQTHFVDHLMRAHLAEDLGEGQYRICGVDERIEYLRKKKKAGTESAAARRAKSGSAQPEIKCEDDRTQFEHNAEKGPLCSNTIEKTSNRIEPPSPSPSPSPSPAPDNKESAVADSLHKPKVRAAENLGKQAIALYCERFKARYGSNPPISGKEASELKSLAKTLGLKRLEALLWGYLEMNDQWFLTKRHSVSTLSQNLNSVAVFVDTGQSFTRKQVQAAETTSHNERMIVEALRRIGDDG